MENILKDVTHPNLPIFISSEYKSLNVELNF